MLTSSQRFSFDLFISYPVERWLKKNILLFKVNVVLFHLTNNEHSTSMTSAFFPVDQIYFLWLDIGVQENPIEIIWKWILNIFLYEFHGHVLISFSEWMFIVKRFRGTKTVGMLHNQKRQFNSNNNWIFIAPATPAFIIANKQDFAHCLGSALITPFHILAQIHLLEIKFFFFFLMLWVRWKNSTTFKLFIGPFFGFANESAPHPNARWISIIREMNRS